MTIENRISQLRAWDVAYFSDDKPLVSDAEYDRFREETRRLAPAHPYFRQVGAPIGESAWPKVRHTAPMTSLNKLWNSAELTAWVASIEGAAPSAALFVTNKLDGISISLRYERGLLVRALTRGEDGLVGEDITRNVRQMRGVPGRLSRSLTGHARGEIVVRRSEFERHFRPAGYKNCRNAAGGSAKDFSGERAALLDVFCYEWLPDDRPLASKEDEFEAAQNWDNTWYDAFYRASYIPQRRNLRQLRQRISLSLFPKGSVEQRLYREVLRVKPNTTLARF
jgi:DNA ligase (NAD+)